MSHGWWYSAAVLLILVAYDGACYKYSGGNRWGRGRQRQVFSYPRDWDTDWTQERRQGQTHRREDHPSVLRPRLVVLPGPQPDSRGLWHSQQLGSAVIPYSGATVRVTPNKGTAKKFYRGVVTSTITDGHPLKRRGNKSFRQKNRGPLNQEHWEYSQDEPVSPPKVCARCPSDRAVLVKRGASSVVMEVPPIIPCHPWSSVEKVKVEVVAGPKPGSEVPEGSHKVVIRLYHHRRTITTCITRYNVIVRRCPELEFGLGVKADCSLGTSWGSVCNITCDPGYDLEGDLDTECTDDLEWSGVIPQCIPTTACSVPVGPDNGHLSCRTPQHQPIRPKGMLPDGTVCHYLCDSGYTIPLAQQHLTKVRCIAGTWDSDQDPVCIETNELEEEDLSPEINAEDVLRFDGKDCPKDFCKNRGRCIIILDEPMCSCRSGYTGPHCEDRFLDPEESNTIT